MINIPADRGLGCISLQWRREKAPNRILFARDGKAGQPQDAHRFLLECRCLVGMEKV